MTTDDGDLNLSYIFKIIWFGDLEPYKRWSSVPICGLVSYGAQRSFVFGCAEMMSFMGCEYIREENRRWKFE